MTGTLIGGGARRSAQQIDLSCYHVRMQRILAVGCFFRNTAEEAAFLSAVNRSIHGSNAYRNVDAPVVPQASGRNRDPASIQIDIHIARNLLHFHLSCGHIDPQARLSRHFNADPDIGSFRQIACDGEGFVILIALEPDADTLGVVLVAQGARDMNRRLIRAHNLETRWQ
jgi:hypothetical protein